MNGFIRPGVPALVLAPMDGVTDYLMREVLCGLLPFSFCVTEFVRVSGLVPPDHVLLREVPELESGMQTQNGVPVSLQILGGNPDRMAATAARAVSLGARAIDINFGCPAPTVNRHDGGATLLQYPERLEAIVAAVRAAVPSPIPVSAKLRLGWDDPRAIIVNAERVERAGATWITIHGRTKMQGYTPPAYWRPIGEVRRALSIPVVANGEIWCREDLERCHDQTGAIHFMIGRGALAEPGIVQECATFLGLSSAQSGRELCSGYPALCGDNPARWWSVLQKLMRVGSSYGVKERFLLARVKQWLGYAHRRGTISWFDQIKRVEGIEQLSEIFARLSAIDSIHRADSTLSQCPAPFQGAVNDG